MGSGILEKLESICYDSLPEEFIERLGKLKEHQYNAKVGLVLSFTHQVLRVADRFVWLMSDHSLIDSYIVFDIERDRNRSLAFYPPGFPSHPVEFCGLPSTS
jgi:hypothetical protein